MSAPSATANPAPTAEKAAAAATGAPSAETTSAAAPATTNGASGTSPGASDEQSKEASPSGGSAQAVDKFPNKVFVGNLSFKTTDARLSEYFSPVGEVMEARIITRGPRSLGYGFVAFADEATVMKAVETMNKKEFDGREINVESARPMPEGALEARTKPRRVRNQVRNKGANKARVDGGSPDDAANDQANDDGSVEDASQSKNGYARLNRRRFPKKNNKSRSNGTGKTMGKQSTENRTPSDTVTFVGNLPFATKDEELSKLFSEFSVVSAHVVINKYSGRPKGFGFVTFATAEDQAKALDKFTNEPIVLSERTLTIKAALSETPAATDSASETADAETKETEADASA